MNPRRDWTTAVGLALVALSAAILTFTTLRDLAIACGITESFLGVPLSWLVPVTVDAAGMVAARVWLGGHGDARAVRAARALALVCIGLSVFGNAGQHGMEAFAVPVPWWVVVTVTAVPPAMLGAVGGLVHLLGAAGHRAVTEPVQVTGPAAVQVTARKPVRVTAPAPAAAVQVDRAEAVTEAVQVTAPVTGPVTAGPAPDLGSHTGQAVQVTDDDVLAWLRHRAGEDRKVPSRKAVMEKFRIGAPRADRLRGQVTVPKRLRTVQ